MHYQKRVHLVSLELWHVFQQPTRKQVANNRLRIIYLPNPLHGFQIKGRRLGAKTPRYA